MAKRFALFFNCVEKDREAITYLHRDAILFATISNLNPNDQTRPPPNLAFLEIADEFTFLMLKEEKISVLTFFQASFLDSVKKNSISSTEWESLLHYLKSLKNF